MPNHFDKILRENIGAIILPLSKKYFGFQIVKARDLPAKLQLTTEREPDFLKLVEAEDGTEFILHLEFQTQNDPRMIFRMQTYHALLAEIYQKEVRQAVLYLGASPPRMRTELRENEVMRGFTLTSLRSIDYQDMLDSDIPEEIILAILADFKGRDPKAVIRLLLQRLLAVGKNEKEVRKALQQLGMLSRLRKLDSEIIDISKDMPIVYDIREDELFNSGRAEGRAEGIAEGIAEGKAKGKAEVVIGMLKDGMKDLNRISRITGLPLEQVREIARKYR